jgi:hypothetical protein
MKATQQIKSNPENFRQGRVLSPLALAPRSWRLISLTQGQSVIVDAFNFEYLNQWRQ